MSLRYTLHSQPRISTLALTITHVDPTICEAFHELSVEQTQEGLTVGFSSNGTDEQIALQYTIPVPGYGFTPRQHQHQTITLDPARETYECKITCNLTTRKNTSFEGAGAGNTLDILRPPLGAEVLNQRNVKMARCRVCRESVWRATTTCAAPATDRQGFQSTIIPNEPAEIGRKRQRLTNDTCSQTPLPPPPPPPIPTPYTFRALPSAHWHESSEAWLCHPSGEFTGKIQKMVEKGWWPTLDVGLVAERWVSVCAGQVPPDEHIEPSLTNWTTLHCACGANLGTRNARWLVDPPTTSDIMEGIQLDDNHGGGAADGAAGNRVVAVTYRLEKYAVEFLTDDEDANSLASSCTVDECLAIEMLEHAQSLGIRKFVVLDERAEEERLFLWLFNPDTDISWGAIHLDMQTGALTSNSKSGKFVTVLWREITSEKPIPASERHEVLDYPASAIEQIRAVLEGDETSVPRDGKMMGEWRVGYLSREGARQSGFSV